MIAALTNHLWQSTLFVLAAALVALALRKNGAHVRHRVWLVASLKFLVPFSLAMSLGSLLPNFMPVVAPAAAPTTPELSIAVDRIAQPFSDDVFVSTSSDATASPATNWAPIVITGIWLCGCFAVLAMRLRGWLLIRAAVRASVPASLAGPVPVRSAPGLLEPGVVGVLRPILLLPVGIDEQLTPAQLNAVLTHEFCHVQRRDNLTSAIHMAVEAAFWFHPLVWFVGAKLVDERERACDEYVLRVCGEPRVYAESILNVCKLYVESPIACVSGVSGADLKRRISAIIGNRVGLPLNLSRKVALTLAAALAIASPLVAGALLAPLQAFNATVNQGAVTPVGTAPASRFDVVSVKPCSLQASAGGGAAALPGLRGRGAAPGQAQVSPGYAHWDCATLAQLVDQAYVDRDHPLLNIVDRPRMLVSMTEMPRPDPSQPQRVRGGPSWVEEEKFTIEAKGPVDLTNTTLAASPSPAFGALPPAMSQALRTVLEDRFKVKVHRATEQQDMYALTIAKGGLNRERLTAPTAGDCLTPAEYSAKVAAGAAPRMIDSRICGQIFSARDGGMEFSGYTPRRLAQYLSSILDHFVLDRTNVDDTFNFTITPDRSGGMSRDDAAIKALGTLGLKLDLTKGPAEYLVIDSAQKPQSDVIAAPPAPGTESATPGKLVAGPDGQSPSFEVVSIKPCPAGLSPTSSVAGQSTPSGGRSGGMAWYAHASPGYVYWACTNLAQLVDQAYADSDHSLLNIVDRPNARLFQPKRVRGGPTWAESDTYAIEVKAPLEVTNPAPAGATSQSFMRLKPSMSRALQVMLEDRFKVKVHRATEQADMYALTIAKGGINKNNLVASAAGDCRTSAEYAAAAQTPPAPFENPKICGMVFNSMEASEYSSFTLQHLAQYLSGLTDRYVLDKTGIEGTFNFVFKHASDPEDSPFPGALSSLGLTLVPTKGPAEYLVIDSAQKPRAN